MLVHEDPDYNICLSKILSKLFWRNAFKILIVRDVYESTGLVDFGCPRC